MGTTETRDMHMSYAAISDEISAKLRHGHAYAAGMSRRDWDDLIEAVQRGEANCDQVADTIDSWASDAESFIDPCELD